MEAEMKSPIIVMVLISVFLCMISCNGSNRFFSETSIVPDGKEVVAYGVFDLKSICMNAGENNVVTDDFCYGYFSENAEPNVRAVKVEITICSPARNINCIERLPPDAPPEVIVIKDDSGSPIAGWYRNKVVLIPKTLNSKRRFEVIRID